MLPLSFDLAGADELGVGWEAGHGALACAADRHGGFSGGAPAVALAGVPPGGACAGVVSHGAELSFELGVAALGPHGGHELGAVPVGLWVPGGLGVVEGTEEFDEALGVGEGFHVTA